MNQFALIKLPVFATGFVPETPNSTIPTMIKKTPSTDIHVISSLKINMI